MFDTPSFTGPFFLQARRAPSKGHVVTSRLQEESWASNLACTRHSAGRVTPRDFFVLCIHSLEQLEVVAVFHPSKRDFLERKLLETAIHWKLSVSETLSTSGFPVLLPVNTALLLPGLLMVLCTKA